jgi:hypothetical protein
MKLNKSAQIIGVAILVIAIVGGIFFITTKRQVHNFTSHSPSIMKKVISYEIHLAVDPASGAPVIGTVTYQLAGEAASRQINNLQPPDLAAISSMLSGTNIFFDTGSNEFIRKN